MILQLHSYWAYITIVVLLLTIINSSIKAVKKKNYTINDFRKALFALILSLFQLLIGLAWYFMSPAYKRLKEIGFENTMKHDTIRLLTIEHPIVMILAITLIIIGYIKHNKKVEAAAKFKILFIYYGIALVLILSRLPWDQWFD